MNFKTTDMLSFIAWKVNVLEEKEPYNYEEKRELQRLYDFWDEFDSFLRDGNGETYIKDGE